MNKLTKHLGYIKKGLPTVVRTSLISLGMLIVMCLFIKALMFRPAITLSITSILFILLMAWLDGILSS